MIEIYVQRNLQGAICGLFGCPQPLGDGSFLTEAKPLRADHPDVVAYRNPLPTLNDYRVALQAHVDGTAQARGYDSGISCASYVGSTNGSWLEEALTFVAWRDAVWAHVHAELAKVQAGERPQPTIAEIVAELKPIVWPA